MIAFEESKTRINLMRAFAGESQARNRYTCAAALAQIEEKKYAEGLRRRGMKKILKYGIAFWEKECMVVPGVTDQ